MKAWRSPLPGRDCLGWASIADTVRPAYRRDLLHGGARAGGFRFDSLSGVAWSLPSAARVSNSINDKVIE